MSNGTVLIVEDDEDLACMLEYNLGRKGYLTITALNGLNACRLIEANTPDLILLDIMLPGMDGWEICRIIRHHDRKDISEIPIIMLTALGSAQEKLKGIEIGADDYIPKPYSIKEVMLKVERLLRRQITKRHLDTEVRRLEAREAQRNDFQDMLFHELKNQLMIIGGYSNRIAKQGLLNPEEYRHCAAVISEHSQALNALAEEMLLLYRLEEGSYHLPVEEVSLETTVTQIVSALSTQADEKEIRVNLERTGKLPVLRLNPFAVKLALSNLLENAIKYSPKQSDITVRTALKGETGVTIEVIDRGPGIPENERSRIFGRYYRGENVKNRTKGTGLGLYISKTLIESMGGVIRLETNNRNGTCFRVDFYPEPVSSTLEDP